MFERDFREQKKNPEANCFKKKNSGELAKKLLESVVFSGLGLSTHREDGTKDEKMA